MKTKVRVVLSPEHSSLGWAVRETRLRRGMSQEELGQEADLHRNYVGAVERGEMNPTYRLLLRLARGLRTPLSELLDLAERRHREWYREPLAS